MEKEALVMCMYCKRLARFTYDSHSGQRTWHWHEPCQYCGREQYRSIDDDRYTELFSQNKSE